MNTQLQPDTPPQSDFMRGNKISSTRALTFYSVGVVAGLILGGIGLFNARGTTTNKVPPEDLALVNQRPILRSDFITQLETETGESFDKTTRADQLRVLDEMIREELFVQRGLEMDFAETDQPTRLALYDVVEQQAYAEVTVDKVTEEQLHKFFDSHRNLFMTDGQLDLHDLVQPDSDKDKATAAVAALRQGMALEKVKQQYGLEEEKYAGKQPYVVVKTNLGDVLFAKVNNMAGGTVSDPLPSDNGLHVVQVIDNEIPVQKSYDDAHGELSFVRFDTEKARVLNNVFKFLRGRSTIFIGDDYKKDYDPDALAKVEQP